MDVGNEVNISSVTFTNDSLDATEDNVTQEHNETSLDSAIDVVAKIINPVAIVLCLFTVAVNLPLLIVLKRCRKIPVPLKWLSMNFVFSTILYFATLSVMSISLLTIDKSRFQAFHDFRMMTALGIYTVECVTTGGLALERYIKLVYPYRFHIILSKRNASIFLICIWGIGLTVPIGICTKEIISTCDLTFKSCDLSSALYANRIIFSSVFTSVSLLVLCTSIKIKTIVNRQIETKIKSIPLNVITVANNHGINLTEASVRKNVASQRSFRATQNMLKIILIYVIFHAPFSIHGLMFTLTPEWKDEVKIEYLQLFAFICTLISSYSILYVYVWKFRECKMHFLNLCCSWSQRHRDLARRLYIDVYDIVTARM